MKVSDAKVMAVFDAYDRERAAKGRHDTRWVIQSTADELELTYAQVRDVFVARMTASAG